MAFNHNGNGGGINPNQMGFFGSSNNNPNAKANAPTAQQIQIAQALGVNPSQITPAALATLRERQAQRQQQQQLLQQAQQMQSRPQQTQQQQQQAARQGSPNPQMLQAMMAQAQAQAQHHGQPIPSNQPQRTMAALQGQLPPGLQNALQNARADPRQQAAMLAQIAQGRNVPNQGSSPMLQNRALPSHPTFNPALNIQGSISPMMVSQGLGPGTTSPQPTFNPSMMNNSPVQNASALFASPPRTEARRPSFTQTQQQNGPSSGVTPPTQMQTANTVASTVQARPPSNPSTVANTIVNPGMASAIPNAPPATFKLDDTKLKVPKGGDRAQNAGQSQTSAAPAAAPTVNPHTTQTTSQAPSPAPGTTPNASATNTPVATPLFPPPKTSLKTAPSAPAVAREAPKAAASSTTRTDGRHVDFAGERKKGTEGMRGSMRNELARLMYAAGDEPEPDVNSVDYMEDLVTEFLSDLCRPVPPMRQAPGQPYQAVPLTTTIVRDRLQARPPLKKYLDRFDTMAFLNGEINKNRRTFQSAESYTDLVETVGRNYLEIDAAQIQPNNQPKKRGRKKEDGVKKEEGDATTPKKKPGPRKGWKRDLAADGSAAGAGGTPIFGPDGRKVRRANPAKRRKKDDGAGGIKREGSAVREGSTVSRTGSPMVG